jgi:predicted DCC family thiol-disulfide oxidoreductase YuxK
VVRDVALAGLWPGQDGKTRGGELPLQVRIAQSMIVNKSSAARNKAEKEQLSILQKIFGLDLRSLAAYRIGISLFILYDLLSRSRALTAHYTDFGVMPRAFASAYFSSNPLYTSWNPAAFSVHMLTGSVFGTACIFFIHAIAAVGLLLGFRTRLMTFIVWFLLASLHTRNPLVLSGADDLVRVFLFFAIFLPLGARYSIDAALNTAKSHVAAKNGYLSPSTAVFYFQFICVYFFTALLKSGPEWRTDGTAIYYALNIDEYVLPLGKILLGFPRILPVLTFTVWWMELLGAFVFLIPSAFTKLLAIVLFTCLYLGFGLTLALGHFPWVNIITLLPFLPAFVWERKAGKQLSERPGVEIIYDGDCGFCRKMVAILVEFSRPRLIHAPHAAQGKDLVTLRREKSWIVRDENGTDFLRYDALHKVLSSGVFRWAAPILGLKPVRVIGTAIYRVVAGHRGFGGKVLGPLRFRPLQYGIHRWRESVVVLLFAGVLMYNVAWVIPSVGLRHFVEIPLLVVRGEQYWGMFAPAPTKDDGWFVVEGRLRSGAIVEPFRGSREVRWEKPKAVPDFYVSERWRRYMMNIAIRDFKDYRPPFTNYLCWDWNRKHTSSDQLDQISLFFMQEQTAPPGQKSVLNKLHLSDFACRQP